MSGGAGGGSDGRLVSRWVVGRCVVGRCVVGRLVVSWQLSGRWVVGQWVVGRWVVGRQVVNQGSRWAATGSVGRWVARSGGQSGMRAAGWAVGGSGGQQLLTLWRVPNTSPAHNSCYLQCK